MKTCVDKNVVCLYGRRCDVLYAVSDADERRLQANQQAVWY